MNKSAIGLILGGGLVAAGFYLWSRSRGGVPSTQAGSFGTSGLAPAPSRFSLGGQRAVPQTQPVGAPASWSSIAGSGINALGNLAKIWIERRSSQPGVLNTSGGRAVATDPVATPGITPGIPINLDSGVTSYDIGDPVVNGTPAVGDAGAVGDWA